MINIRNLIIIVLCATIVCMGVGFAYLSMRLENYNITTKSYDVGITKVTNGTSTKGGATSPTGTSSIINGDKTVNFSFSLTNPKDSLSYNIIIKNNGNIPARIDNILENPDINNLTVASSIAPIKIEHNNIVGRVIKANEELTLTISVSYTNTLTPEAKNINYQISILTSEAS